MITRDALAKRLDMCGKYEPKAEDTAKIAEESGLVVLHMTDEDVMMATGAVKGMFYFNKGYSHILMREGFIYEDTSNRAPQRGRVMIGLYRTLRSDGSPGYVRIMVAGVPSSSFRVMYKGELFCIGCVIRLSDIGHAEPDGEKIKTAMREIKEYLYSMGATWVLSDESLRTALSSLDAWLSTIPS